MLICLHTYIMSEDCGVPLPPINGSILNMKYHSTTVGSQVFYQCNSGMIPSGRMRSFCTLDEGWSPNPVLVVCRVPGKVDCYMNPLWHYLFRVIFFCLYMKLTVVIRICQWMCPLMSITVH